MGHPKMRQSFSKCQSEVLKKPNNNARSKNKINTLIFSYIKFEDMAFTKNITFDKVKCCYHQI